MSGERDGAKGTLPQLLLENVPIHLRHYVQSNTVEKSAPRDQPRRARTNRSLVTAVLTNTDGCRASNKRRTMQKKIKDIENRY